MQAVSFVNHTNRNIFLTGKAGTGKTTFLRYIREHSYKKMAVAAPTGVAAINAGGTTLHALFWLPFGMYIENYELAWNDDDHHIYNRRRLFSKVKLTKQRRELLQEIELLVIDEVSMVRADLLDAIDAVLRSVRRDARPFGGLQLLFVGDMYQLPPVIKDREREMLHHHYPSPFFFDANVLRQHPPLLLELRNIYRQSDPVFIDLLNSIRDNCCTTAQLELLNSYYKPEFVPQKENPYITLTTHNHRAEAINNRELDALPVRPVQLKAIVKDDFSEGAFPVDEVLELKLGAQVMFVRNDSGEDRKFYNGKIGFVQHIDEEGHVITVGFENGDESVRVQREVWENIRYNYDKKSDKINEEVLGTFAQFPLRLAWAITIHKSQGLTFDRAMIDAGASFAAGQVYVALSRLRSLDGLILQSRIPSYSIRTDKQVAAFSSAIMSDEAIGTVLESSQKSYLGHILVNGFKWDYLMEIATNLLTDLAARNIADQEQAYAFVEELLAACSHQKEVADKFRNQLNRLLNGDNTDYTAIYERTAKAVDWFVPQLTEQVITPLESHIRAWAIKKRTKRYIDELKAFFVDVKRKKELLQQTMVVTEALAQGRALPDIMEKVSQRHTVAIDAWPATVGGSKSAKGETKRISLQLFQSGKSVKEIALARDLTKETIIRHLTAYLGQGVNAVDLVDKTKLKYIIATVHEHPGKPSSTIKAILGDGYSYDEIRVAQAAIRVDGGFTK